MNTYVIYNFILNTPQNIKNNSQYQYEPILWKLNSILNDSTLSIYVLITIYSYVLYNYTLKINNASILLLLYVFIHSWKNQLIFSYLLKITAYNTTLFNGLLLVHPICLYLSYGYIIYLYVMTVQTKNNSVQYFTIIFFKNKFFLTSSLVALILGCWWAQQEVSWGGWWNWDPIEMIALLSLVISLLVNHLTYKYQSLLFFFRPLIVIFVITTYFVSRYDILNSIHSFALASTSQNYLELKIFMLYTVICINFRRLIKNNKVSNLVNLKNTVCVIFYCYFTFIVATILYEIGLNNIKSSNVTPHNDKYAYLIMIFTLCLSSLFREKLINLVLFYELLSRYFAASKLLISS